jgi:transcriptional regulator with XRE-family HTH domain
MKCKTVKRNYVPGTSRSPRNPATLLAQMGDYERGLRIKELREGRHLTQPALADRVGVTLRAYQEWEAGGGIQWDNAKRLAKALCVTPDFVMNGQKPDTPRVLNGLNSETRETLERLEANQETILRELRELRALLRDLALEELEQVLREAAGRQQQRPADSSATDNS